MRRILAALAVVSLLSLTALAVPPGYGDGGGGQSPNAKILTFSTMHGVFGPFLSDLNPIRGVIGDDLPWVVRGSAKGKLDRTGRLKIRIKGLVFPNDPSVPPELRGINDEPSFRALVSCMTVTAQDQVVTTNVSTGNFAANSRGDSNIEAALQLPNPCLAPIIFILGGSDGTWFAVSGVESAAD